MVEETAAEKARKAVEAIKAKQKLVADALKAKAKEAKDKK